MDLRIDVVFDISDTSPYFAPTIDAVHHAVSAEDLAADVRVRRTNTIDSDYLNDLPDAVVMGPGTPYLAPNTAEQVITTARERGVPLVGT